MALRASFGSIVAEVPRSRSARIARSGQARHCAINAEPWFIPYRAHPDAERHRLRLTAALYGEITLGGGAVEQGTSTTTRCCVSPTCL